jgi:23S rRNA G2069 N7-methylase RlmK/C1962 C5-methylase RlmI
MSSTPHHNAICNRLRKRYAHLKQWVRTHQIEFFRLFDRDLPQAPFIIDALPNHWLVWVCDHQLNPADQMALVTCISNTLNGIQKKNNYF